MNVHQLVVHMIDTLQQEARMRTVLNIELYTARMPRVLMVVF